jgi:hypothetical protein
MTASSPITFLYTNSYDGTADLVVRELGPKNVFRFNFDLWADYHLRLGPRDFEISSPAGLTIRPADVAKVYWRKPMPAREIFPERHAPTEEVYAEAEMWYALRDLINLLWQQGKVVLVEPFAENRVGKFVQMRVAADLFDVPPWKFLRGSPEDLVTGKQAVVKSLTLNRVADRAVIYATRVPEADLDPSSPWLLQDYVEADQDITVVFVRGRLFALELERSFTARAIDWRPVSLEPAFPAWRPHVLPESLAAAIYTFMARLSLDYGRLDLLLTSSGDYAFLEVNPHGEWGWLDPQGERGILRAIIDEVSPHTPVHPLPIGPGFAMPA